MSLPVVPFILLRNLISVGTMLLLLYICRYSRGQKKVGQCFFANINLLAFSMVTMKICIYLL
jgi:hypothetical protein